MSELTPITRVESYLDAIVNSGIPPTEDITRIETFLQAIYDNQVCQLTPITRIEMFLGKISGQDIVLPEPITRIELYLAAIAGEDAELPETPITRLEMYLAEWADSGDWTTISGAIVEFITQRAHKLKSCVVSLSPIQDLSHGDPSPTNICPISGWTGCEVYQSGANFGFLTDSNKMNSQYCDITYQNGGVVVEATSQFGRSGYTIPIKEGQQYTISFKGKRQGAVYGIFIGSVATWDYDYTIINAGGGLDTDFSTFSYSFTAKTDVLFFGIYVNNVDSAIYIEDFQLTLGSTASDYEPYNGKSYSVTWEDEVFGATIDVINGNCGVTKEALVFDNSAWEFYDNFFYKFFPAIIGAVANNYYTSENGVKMYLYSSNGQVRVYLGDNPFLDSSSDLGALLNGYKTVYNRQTPRPFTITPTPITALKGYNAMWSDAGDIEVTVHGTPVEVETLQALNLLLGGAYRNSQTQEDVSDNEALDILLGGADR